MHSGFEFNELETRLKMTLDALSNGGSVHVDPDWIKDSSDEFEAALNKQLGPQEVREFKLRASNIGKPLCQLQLDAFSNNKTPSQREYNHILRMMVGDATEAAVNLIIKASGANITGQKGRVEFKVGETIIKGENDIEIDNKVYDVKSCSSYAFQNKWEKGWEGLLKYDGFGYVEQLFIYAEGDPNRMGGWIVFDKSSGEIKVVEARPTPEQLDQIRAKIELAEVTIREGRDFKRLFQPEVETFYKKPTGNMVLPMTCVFCDHKRQCWPDAVYASNPSSKAETPPKKWYAEKPTFKGTE